MTIRRRLAVLATALLTVPLITVIFSASPASAHGWITSPPSRQDQCATGVVANCGSIQYEPQSVEAPKGSRNCSGGSSFTVLDQENKGWRVTNISSSTTFSWRNTAMHRTLNWQYYVDGNLHQTFTNGNAQPPQVVNHNVTGLPSGRHKVLAVWNIYDTPMAFYACVDVNVGGGGGGPTTPPPTGSCGTAWSASAVYTGGMTVSHKSRKYTARWWTQGEEPGTTGEWGVWQDNGAC
ncbi:lytic polysaccharide monooxygenase [Dactylosporangium sp. NBC_01737]|uniref:lytic polysaccharide monooxygenase n=1 Tax=Dactylosporangium sp. NBC_01737 TaxID=2975959 RepID=UPI002E0FF612|nr:lytic polysaccharide monooxygenase [Dactylosporangium sp. NBC_01737]